VAEYIRRSYHWIEYIRRSGTMRIFQVFLEVDQILPRADFSGVGKRSTTYWRLVEPAAKRFASVGSGSVLVGSTPGGSGGSISSRLVHGGSEGGILGGQPTSSRFLLLLLTSSFSNFNCDGLFWDVV
jgi:hypothetical protein